MPISRSPLVLALLAALALTLAPAALAQEAAPWRDWQTSAHAGDALAGKIWSVREKRFVAPAALTDALAKADFVLIGEVHDNPDHHRLQAWLIDEIAKDRKPAIVMEMISLDQEPALQAYMASPGSDAAGLGAALDWGESGWPDWPNYQPIAEAVFRAGLALLPGDPSRTTIRSVSSGGFDSLAPGERTRLALDGPLPGKLAAALDEDIRESHCDLLPEAALGPMAQVQRFRDAALAGALAEAGGEGGAILITGNGHVRTDRGVPWYLARRAPETSMSSVMLLELDEGENSVAGLTVAGPDGEPAADYFWFTPRAEREDQCEKLRQRLQK